ncbi:purine-binding chemotaxis protein CheW [Ectothiorhodospira magna]|uniref:Purine-binding chemotaxis protein CheW n=1 Tax=Ectothiorhodospira magna TaxID=867345 RepID=A0A1H9DV58_9GAMM|nr:chemotaxis protein CheW [Ectothiorhodospira magna]SEQ17354.1 purine-binding chemotaxis protein CheW [Ectothiorhodospira magna]
MNQDARPERSEKQQRLLVVDEPKALTAYLDDLLQEIADVEPLPPVVEVSPPPPPPAPAPVKATVTPIKPVVATPPPPAPPPRQDVPPAWGQVPFQCLLFRLGGLALAVPLVKLTGIMTMPRDITPMPGHSPMFLGLVNHHGRKVKVVDIGAHVLPPDRQAQKPPPANLILIDEGRWGLACDRVEETLMLTPDLVRWRSPSGRRPWLSGTVIKHLCAIIDVDFLARTLEQGDWG